MAAASLDVNLMKELRANVRSLILIIFHSLVHTLGFVVVLSDAKHISAL
jgi:hypothetical protein